MSDDRKPIGAVLRRLMAEQDIRAEEVASKLGVSYATVMRWRAGKSEPTHGTAVRLAELFGVKRCVFFEETAAQ
jgi:transcriptional regulator with XRE-family HTH domain